MTKEERNFFKQQTTLSTSDGDARGDEALKLPSNLPWLQCKNCLQQKSF